MNALLKLEFFKSLGFPSKESGVEFINQNKNLRKEIEEKVEELEEARYEIIELSLIHISEPTRPY